MILTFLTNSSVIKGTEEVTGHPSKICNSGKKCICETVPPKSWQTTFVLSFFLFAHHYSDPLVLNFLFACPSSVISAASFKTVIGPKGTGIHCSRYKCLVQRKHLRTFFFKEPRLKTAKPPLHYKCRVWLVLHFSPATREASMGPNL